MRKIICLTAILFSFVFANAQTDSLQQFTGKFRFPDGSPVAELTLAVENGVLMGTSAIGNSEFRQTTTADVFEIVAYGGTATFRRKDGKVTGGQILVGDVNIEGTKSELQIADDYMLDQFKAFPYPGSL